MLMIYNSILSILNIIPLNIIDLSQIMKAKFGPKYNISRFMQILCLGNHDSYTLSNPSPNYIKI